MPNAIQGIYANNLSRFPIRIITGPGNILINLNITPSGLGDQVLIFNGGTQSNAVLPTPAIIQNYARNTGSAVNTSSGYFYIFRNAGTANLIIQPTSATIEGVATYTL